jgi:hypothetical protein
MDEKLKIFVSDEAEPDVALFELESPELPRQGDVVGDFMVGTYRVEKRVFVLGPDEGGVRRVKGITLVSKQVIV